MAQATLLGLNTDNVVTVLTPSSTIESPFGTSDTVSGSGSLTLGTPIQLPTPTTTVYIVMGTLSLTLLATETITISIGSFFWSQQVMAGAVKIPFQTISRGSSTLLVSGAVGTATYTYTATSLRTL